MTSIADGSVNHPDLFRVCSLAPFLVRRSRADGCAIFASTVS